MFSRLNKPVGLIAALLMLVLAAAPIAAQGTQNPFDQTFDPGTPQFQRTWERTDYPVQQNQVDRSYIWGPSAFTDVMNEPYAQSPGGQRQVQYFDKSRMEINNPNAPDDGLWFVTNGLLVRELMTGQMQVGDAEFEDCTPVGNCDPANVHIAGDPGFDQTPTYATFGTLMDEAPHQQGAVINATVDVDGNVGTEDATTQFNVTADEYVADTNHTVASVFWDFMTSQGVVYENGEYVNADLFDNPFYAVGLPLTEAYWARVPVAGADQWVLTQAFERRVLTYTPSNPEGFQVEMGNVGQHYWTWRYGEMVDQPSGDTVDLTDQVYSATLTGDAERPDAVQTDASGDAVVFVNGDGNLEYEINVVNIESAVAAHIHLGSADEAGPVVVPLYASDQGFSGTGTLAHGVITPDMLTGDLEGMTLENLAAQIEAGNTYVNVHTTANQAGEIRGQLELVEGGTGGGENPPPPANEAVTYQVTIQNLTGGQPFSPPVAATHQDGLHIFQTGELTSDELEAVAEDGNPGPLYNLLDGSAQVTNAVNVSHPITPQGIERDVMGNTITDSATFEINANPGDVFSIATMLICTNDGFLGLDSVNLPESGSVSYDLNSYDAGTEENTELSQDIVDPCSALGPVMLPGDPNMNVDDAVNTDPAQPIAAHAGIQGVGDLTVADHGWSDPVAQVTITVMDGTTPPPPPAAETQTYSVMFGALNHSGVEANGTLTLDNGQLTVEIEATGLQANMVHPQHLHGFLAESAGDFAVCPSPSADTTGDDLVDLAEGNPFYGDVQLPLDDGAGTFPSADADGALSYSHTFDVDQAAFGEVLEDHVLVLHGMTNPNTTNYEATLPVACGLIVPDTVETYSTEQLDGDNEVPDPIFTNSSGQATFWYDDVDDVIYYLLTVDKLQDTTAAHIHMGGPGVAGDVVVPLFTTGENESYDVTGLLASGRITADDFTGPLAGMEMSDLVDLFGQNIDDSEAYVNVHTEMNPGGELRDQVAEFPG